MMTPYYIKPNRSDAMRIRMDQYGAAVSRIATQYDALFVDTQAEFDKALQTLHPNGLAWDRVHPSTPGHFILARAFLKAVDFTW